MSRIQKLASETALYGVSTIIGRMVNFLLVPLYLNVFPVTRYGVVVQVYTVFMVLNILYQYGMESAYLRFASGKRTPAEGKRVFSTAVWTLCCTSLLFAALVAGARMPLSHLAQVGPEWAFLFLYAAGILSMDALAIVPFAQLRLQNRPLRFAVLKLLNIGVNVGMNLYLIFWRQADIEAIFQANLVASSVTLLLVLPQYRESLRLTFSRDMLQQLVRFALPLVPSGISWTLIDRVNILFLGNLSDAQIALLYEGQLDLPAVSGGEPYSNYIAGIFGAVWKLGIFMGLFVQMFRFAWQPFFLQHADDQDAQPLFARIFSLFSGVVFWVWLALTMLVDELVAIPILGARFIPEAYWFALYLVPVALLAYVFLGWYYHFTAGAYIQKKTNLLMYCGFIGAAVALLLNSLLAPAYGMIGVAWATSAAYASMAVSLFVFMRPNYRVPYQWPRILLGAGLAAILFFMWKNMAGLQYWVYEGGILLVYAGLLALLLAPGGSLKGIRERAWPR